MVATITFFKFAFFLGGLTSLFLGLFIYFQNRKGVVNKTYTGLSLCSAIWSFGFLGMVTSDTRELGVFWRWFMEAGSIWIPALWFHFVCSFLSLNKSKRVLIIAIYISSFALWVLNFIDLFQIGLFTKEMVSKIIFDFYPTAGPGYYLYFIFFFSVASYSIFLLLRSYKREDNLKRKQILSLITGSVFGFGGGGMTFLLTLNIDVVPYGVVLFAFYPLAVAYAIARHHLFDIKVIVTELLTFGIWVFVLARAYVAESLQERVLNGGLLAFLVIFGILLIRSVIKEVRQREQIEKLAGELEEVNKRQEGLLHFMSHEIKGYLTKSEAAFAGILEGDFGEVRSEVENVAKTALADNRRGVKAVTDILQAANLKSGKVSYDRKSFDLKALILKLGENFRPDAEKKGLKFEVNIADGGDFAVVGDENQLAEHVFGNLIKNAIAYTPSGEIVVALAKQNGKIVFSVRDTGVGIAPEDKTHLFTEGGRGKDSVKINVHSTGYGLYIAKQIVLAHDGRIFAESDGASKGSTFFVEL